MHTPTWTFYKLDKWSVQQILDGRFYFSPKNVDNHNFTLYVVSAGGELFMQLEREGIFMEDTAWWVSRSVTRKAVTIWDNNSWELTNLQRFCWYPEKLNKQVKSKSYWIFSTPFPLSVFVPILFAI